MSCPYPGMDPYLESPNIWPDFHASFIPAIRRHLRKLLPSRYRVQVDERIYVDSAALLEEHREVFLEVREQRSGELVTVIELLSPSNKRPGSEGRALYLRKHNLSRSCHLLPWKVCRVRA